MRKTKTIFALVLALVMTLTFCACGVEIGGDETWEYTADNKEGTVELYNNFLEATLKNTNQTVTVKSGDTEVFTENIDGDKDHTVYATNGAKTWAFKSGEDCIYATEADGSQYYMVGEESYNYGYFAYKNYISVFDMLPEEGLTFSTKVEGNKPKDKDSTSTMTIEIKLDDKNTITMTASAKNDLLESLIVSVTEDGNTRTSTLSFTYGSASVTVPDITDWYNASGDM